MGVTLVFYKYILTDKATFTKSYVAKQENKRLVICACISEKTFFIDLYFVYF